MTHLPDFLGVAHDDVVVSGQVQNLVRIVGEVEIHVPAEVVCLHRSAVQDHFHAVVLHLGQVHHHAGDTVRGRQRELIQEGVGHFVEVFHRAGEAVVEESEVHTHIEHFLFLPAQVRVGQAVVRHAGVVTVLVVVRGNPQTQGLVAAESGIVTGGTIAHAQLEVAEPVHVLQEIFLFGPPGGSHREEITPFVVCPEDGGTVPAEGGRCKVFFCIIVLCMTQPGNKGGLGIERGDGLRLIGAGQFRKEVEGESRGSTVKTGNLTLPIFETGHGGDIVHIGESPVEVQGGGAGKHQVGSLGSAAAAAIGRAVAVILVPVERIIHGHVVGRENRLCRQAFHKLDFSIERGQQTGRIGLVDVQLGNSDGVEVLGSRVGPVELLFTVGIQYVVTVRIHLVHRNGVREGNGVIQRRGTGTGGHL